MSAMKKAFSSFKTYLIGFILFVGAFVVSFSIFWILEADRIENSKPRDPFMWHFVLLGIAFLLLLVGWILREYRIIRWRKSTKDYESPLPQDVKDKTWEFFGPILMGALFCIFFVAVLEIIGAALGSSAPVWL